MKAVIYARVSSKEQEETGYSLPAQEKFLTEYADKKGFAVAKVFAISESASGRKQREVFGKMMEYVTKNNFKIVVCEKVDRLTRNFKDAVQIDEWLEEDEERQVHLVKDSLVLHKNSRSQEKLNWGIRILFAKNYIDNLSEEVKKGMAEKLRQGWLPTKPPVGYKTIGEKGHKIHVIDEAKAPLVKQMFELYATGEYGTNVIADMMFEAGLRNYGGHKIYKSRISRLLVDPFYIGQIRYNDAIHPGAHEPLINEDLFKKCGQLLKRNGAPRYNKHFPIFKAMMRCGKCGGLVTWQIQKGKWYGKCGGYHGCGRYKFTKQEEIEAELLKYFDVFRINNGRLAEWIRKAIKESHADKITFHTASMAELNKRLATAEKRLSDLYDDKVDEKITEEFYKQKSEQYTNEKNEVLQTMKRQNTASDKYYELGATICELGQRAREIYTNEKRTRDERRAIMRQIFSNITLNTDKISVVYTPAYQTLADYLKLWNDKFELAKKPVNKRQSSAFDAACPTWLPGSDSNRRPIG